MAAHSDFNGELDPLRKTRTPASSVSGKEVVTGPPFMDSS
ncbi:unnamed protein product [Tetraodon nigroviridis]|uniref:(spotted green pufferfish) hypothetical protein n=1 Tax=Tetraodon nigroviridis TaxID=99883 RepID=Q4RSL4_TETNG|nr:unnamed protein product [Tetraodon nigroviridis]